MTQNDVETVGFVLSYARRSGKDLTLVIQLPNVTEIDSPDVQLRLRGQRDTARIAGTLTKDPDRPGAMLRARVPARSVKPDVYRIAMRPASGGEFGRIQARLLVGRAQPVALLPGPAPRTKMQPPRPRPTSRPRRRAVQAAAKVVDRALRRVPADRAVRYRAIVRRLARRALR